MDNNTPDVLTVVYAKDIGRVAAFYARTLALAVLEEQPGYVVLGRDGMEVAVVQQPVDAAGPVASPPHLREQTPVKPSFLVEDLEHVRVQSAAAGGGLKPFAAAWSWRGQLHLDGHDPEGNIVQFRRREAPAKSPR